ncbi:hypothetical protein [Kibdelosporangium phytohabitans]|uniref:hypothetical protein n=1 Tax=Kibdelosporangium phytohabitans TaxID=860235 RepID=UPI0012F8BACE|nr:hypothetical protein [Kibdelosporangium phytohabitans]MBE1468083.1 hypothetical protein [Kibdelosporangium phytohabitans]
MSEIILPIYVRIDDAEVQIGQLEVEPGVSAAAHLDPFALVNIRNTIEPEPED